MVENVLQGKGKRVYRWGEEWDGDTVLGQDSQKERGAFMSGSLPAEELRKMRPLPRSSP